MHLVCSSPHNVTLITDIGLGFFALQNKTWTLELCLIRHDFEVFFVLWHGFPGGFVQVKGVSRIQTKNCF